MVTGATCEIGRYLLPRLIAGGYTSLAVSRRPPVAGPSLKTEWIQGDISSPDFRIPLDKADILIHLAPLPLWSGLKDEITRLSIKRIIAFGTTSKIFKANSPDLGERRMVAGQIEAEKQMAEFGGQSGVAWTVFRPTIIYGEGPANFVSFLANLIERFRFFPVVGGGLGKRQPVHADDLAMAC